jgi:hypothetical protein
MFRAHQAKYAYRPALLERPSMWRFVLLSGLLHVWLVVLFGDASGGRRDSVSWSRTFFATLERGATGISGAIGITNVLSGTASSGLPPLAVERLPSAAKASDPEALPNSAESEVSPEANSPVPTLTTPTTVQLNPIEIEKIPGIAVDVSGMVKSFSVAPIALESLSPVLSSIAPAISPIPPLPPSAPAVRVGEGGFSMYVPPIIERAAVVASPAAILATPTLPGLAKPQVEREFATYVAPPVLPPTPAPSVALDASSMQAPMPVAPAIPTVQVTTPKPVDLVPTIVETIAPLSLNPATKALETYQPRAVDLAPTRAVSTATTVAAALESTAGPAQNTPTPSFDGAPTAATVSVSPSGVGAAALLNAPLPLPLPPSTPTSQTTPTGRSINTPRLDLDQLRRQARDTVKESSGSRALFPFPMVAREAPKKDMEKIFDKALKRPDCKEVYADLGLLAVAPLLRDAAKDGGCKW